MATVYEIPLQPNAQTLSITLGDTTYNLRLIWTWVPYGTWILDINDQFGTPIVQGIPLVTGVDLIGQYSYLNIGGFGNAGYLFCGSDGDPTTPPTYENLGKTARLWWQPK